MINMRQLPIPPDNIRKNPYKATTRTIKMVLIECLDVLWNVIKSIWRIFIIGAIIVGIIGNAAYEYLTKGHLEFDNIMSLPIIQLAGAHPIFTVCLILILSILIVASFLAHKYRQRIPSSSSQNEFGLQHVSQLNPSNYKLFRYIQHAYILRDADTTVRNILKSISVQSHQNKTHGICIFGKPAQGKTRLAWEAMQAELANWTLVRWPHTAQVPFDFVGQQGKQLILWLDDLHEYANPTESVNINDLLRRFIEEGASLIVIATCRDGEDQLQAIKYLGNLLEQLIPVTLEDISLTEALNLTRILAQEGLEVSNDEFDGTPGSLIFGLQRMTSRYLNLTSSAQNVLKAMKLLHSAQIHTYPEKRVRNVSHDVFGVEKNEWRKAYESLDRSDFIRITILNNERSFESVAEIYLEKVLIDYPTPHSLLIDDWIVLKECFQNYKDAEGLNSLGLATKLQLLKSEREMYLFSEECYNSALKIYFDEHNYVDWAGTQNNLGTLFSDKAEQATRDQAIKLLNKGIEAFNAALTIFSKENTPAGWIMVQYNSGMLLAKKASLVGGEEKLKLLDDAIQIFQDILKTEPQYHIANTAILGGLSIVLSSKALLVEKQQQIPLIDAALQIFKDVLVSNDQGRVPLEWASAQMNLGAALSRKANLANNPEEKHNLLNQSAQSHRAALTVYTKESTPQSWATAQFNLGAALSDDAKQVKGEERNNLLKEAFDAYCAALTVFSKELTPINWSSNQYQLGNVLQSQARLMSEEKQFQQLQEAIQAYNAALEVYNKADFPSEWAMTQDNIGQVLYYKATFLNRQEQCSLLEKSIQAFQKALEVYTQERTQSAWNSAQHSLGNSLHRLSSCVSGNEQAQLLNKAIEAYRKALKGLNKKDNSIEWALVQLNLSIALGSLALITDRQERQTLLDEGLNASQAALSIYTYENNPLKYAKAEQLLGTFLFFKDIPSSEALQIERIKAAINAFRTALEIFTKENNVSDWAQTQYELGNAITSLYELLQENITRDLATSAINAYQSALEVYTSEKNPKQWAGANIGIALTYHVSSLFIEDKNIQVALLSEAHRILDSVLTTHTSDIIQEDLIFPTMLSQRIKDDLDKIKNTQ